MVSCLTRIQHPASTRIFLCRTPRVYPWTEDMPRAELFHLLVLAISSAHGYDVPLNTHKIDFWDTNQARCFK